MQDRFRQVPAKLRRTWKVPESVDASGIRARLAHGELIITLPKMAKVCAMLPCACMRSVCNELAELLKLVGLNVAVCGHTAHACLLGWHFVNAWIGTSQL